MKFSMSNSLNMTCKTLQVNTLNKSSGCNKLLTFCQIHDMPEEAKTVLVCCESWGQSGNRLIHSLVPHICQVCAWYIWKKMTFAFCLRL